MTLTQLRKYIAQRNALTRDRARLDAGFRLELVKLERHLTVQLEALTRSVRLVRSVLEEAP